MGMKIYPVKSGGYQFPRSYLLDTSDQTVLDLPILAFYIEGADKKILVDTGACDPDSDAAKLHVDTYYRPEEERLDRALKSRLGVSAEEIDIVIMSHLHWDHAGQMDLFPNAEFWVRMDEIIDSVNPTDRYKGTYESFNSGHVPGWAAQPRKWRFIEDSGDVNVVPGIDLIMLPGHSRGLQGVLVQTDDGKYLLPSDIVMQYDQIDGDGKVSGSPLCLDPEKNKESLERIGKLIREEHVTVIPSHDMRVLEHKVYPYENKENRSGFNPGVFPMGKELPESNRPYFSGTAYLGKLLSGPVEISNTVFEPGCRNNWHIHHGVGQILLVTGGEGWYQEWDKPARKLAPGDVVDIPVGVKHWHGAAKGSWFSHVVIKQHSEQASNEWLEPVTDEEYEKL